MKTGRREMGRIERGGEKRKERKKKKRKARGQARGESQRRVLRDGTMREITSESGGNASEGGRCS